MKDLTASIHALRLKYREIFLKSIEEIQKRVNELKPNDADDIFSKYKTDSNGYKWQQNVIKLFDEEISKEIYRKLQEILVYRNEFKCIGCATCCKLACSEFSYKELLERAKNGDNFAQQFTSVFVPYETKEDARKIYPEYIKMLEENENGDVYFYHCPKVDKNNKCSDYKNRPQICRDFPDNPLALLPKTCGYRNWKDEIEPIALMLHAMLEIIEYYKDKIQQNYI